MGVGFSAIAACAGDVSDQPVEALSIWLRRIAMGWRHVILVVMSIEAEYHIKLLTVLIGFVFEGGLINHLSSATMRTMLSNSFSTSGWFLVR